MPINVKPHYPLPGISRGTTGRSPMGGEFDFSKGQIPTNSPSKPGREEVGGRGEVGDNVDRRIKS